ncbi:hypothetical protein [Hymenobacter crusticola]|uniref:Uncharacterized protein n=1 Tax=Hymenobacter crusticola TaxID=1770526 RepID=A0A243WJD4_9BACT|nr:hypothetical protein [Hymenobacter crusticola]OUJ76005.1 hypothetical protein BXP70_01620 [Hymenobacter crusticola]
MVEFVFTSAVILSASIDCSTQQYLVDKPTATAKAVEVSKLAEKLQLRKQLDAVIAAPISKACHPLHHIKQRDHTGLREGERLILTACIFDESGVFELVFAEEEWMNTSTTVVITSDLDMVRAHRKG